MDHRFQIIVFLLLFTVQQGCSSTFEDRQPEEDLEAKAGDNIVVHRPKNSTIGSGPSFAELKQTGQVAKDTAFRVTSFPRAGKRIQDALSSILEQDNDQYAPGQDVVSDIQIPYRHSPEQSDLHLSVRTSTNTVSPDQLSEQQNAEASADLVIAGHVERGLVGMGKAVQKSADRRVADGYGLFHVETSWKIVRIDNGRSETFRVDDQSLVNLSTHPDPVKRFYRIKTVFHQLLRRIAWRVASRVVPHQYDTSFKTENE